ncbi:MAG: M23 family metallopeptidase [Bacillota bacterium]
MHKGLDIDGKAGDNIYAAKKGEVVSSGYTERGGNEVVIKHKNGLTTKYSHLNKLNVQEGDKVTHKTVIGTMGSTG